MLDRRKNGRSKVKKMYEHRAKANENRPNQDRCFNKNGGSVEFTNVINYPKENMSLKTEPKGRSLVAKMVWWRDTFVRIAFGPEVLPELPVSDIAERVRQSERKKQQLQRRINELLGKK